MRRWSELREVLFVPYTTHTAGRGLESLAGEKGIKTVSTKRFILLLIHQTMWLFALICNPDLPTLAQNVGLAGLTILIPVGIAIFVGEKDFKELDNHVILDHVIRAKWLLIYVALIFLPMFFWRNSDSIGRFIELVLWAVGVGLLVYVLALSYKWLKGNKFPLRFAFLRAMTSKQDMEEAWSSVWGSENINPANENEFFEIFSERINSLLSDK